MYHIKSEGYLGTAHQLGKFIKKGRWLRDCP